MFKFFDITKIETLEDLKKEYRKLMIKWHPDKNINNQEEATANSKIINNEYEILFERFKNIHKNTKGEFYEKETQEEASEYQFIINQLMKYNEINIDIIGSWLWISGTTYPIKEELKKLGFKYAKNKNAWFLHFEEWHSSGIRFGNLDNLKNWWGYKTIKKCNEEENKKVKIEMVKA